MNIWCKFLALVILLHIFLCFLLHVQPLISLCKALWDKDLPTGWLPQIPSCNSSRSISNASWCMHSKYGPEKKHLYNFWSIDSQNQRAFLRILSASNFSLGKISSLRNNTMESIQLGLTLIWWIWTTSFFILVGLHKSSTMITRGRLCTNEVTNVARESAWVFPLLRMCYKLKNSNPDCKCLTRLKYSCILSSLASNSTWTWPTTSLEFANISITFPPIS